MALGSESAKEGGASGVVRRGRRMSVFSGKVLLDSLVRLSPDQARSPTP